MTPEELRERNSRKFVELFQTAYDRSPFYRKLYMEAGISRDDIRGIEDIGKLPVLTKEILRKNTELIRTEPRWKLVANHTSGTTGTPLKVWESWPAVWREQAYFYCYRKRCGYRYGQPLVSLRGNLTRGEMRMKVHISNTLFLSSYDINDRNAQFYYDSILAHKPVAIEGYPSSLYALALALRSQQLTLHIPVAFTSSETLFGFQRELIEKQLGTTIYDHYGTTERTISLSEAYDHNGYYADPGYSVNEFTDEGEITTSLINFAFPLIRYKGTDVMEMSDDGMQVVKHIAGRNEDGIVCKDGTRVMRLDFVMKGVKHIRQSQLVQKEKGQLDVLVVPDADYCEEDKRLIERNLTERIGAGNIDYQISIVCEGDLIYAGKKFKYIVNLSTAMGGVKRILGREDDLIECKDGSKLSRVDFVETAKHVEACQWVQREPGRLELLIVPDKDFGQEDLHYIERCTLERLGRHNIDLTTTITTMDGLIYTRRGKFKLIVNINDHNKKQDEH